MGVLKASQNRLKRIGVTLFLFFQLELSAQSTECVDPGYPLYLAGQGDIARAVQSYREWVSHSGSHDFTLLRKLGSVILRQGQFARSETGKVLTLYGAGIAQDAELFDVIRAAVFSSNPEEQLIAVALLDQLFTDQADDLLLVTMGSEFLLPRLEAGYRLILKGHPQAIAQLQALIAKVIPEIHPIFCELLAAAGEPEADRLLRQLMATGSSAVQQAAALSLAKFGRDDFVGDIRRLSRRLDPLQQEAAAVALGQLRDTASIDRLRELSTSAESQVRVAALDALYVLGCEECGEALCALAKSGNLFAIGCLAHVPESVEALAGLLDHSDPQVRLNAAVALVHLRDSRCVRVLAEMLIGGHADRGIVPRASTGGGLTCFEILNSLDAHSRKEPELKELSNSIREALLRETVELDESSFLLIAQTIFSARQNDLVPLLVRLLENKGTPLCRDLLRAESEHLGAPLIRGYATLALFRLDPQGPYAAPLRSWIQKQSDHPLLELRPILPWTKRRQSSRDEFVLTPQETSRLLVESYEALAQQQDVVAVDALLDAIEKGNPDNRYVLAALLMRAAE